MKLIESTQNPAIKHVVKLHNKAYRYEHETFIAQGYTTCMTLIEQKYKLLELYITETAYKKHLSAIEQINPTIVSDHIMQKISTTKTPSGIVALFALPKTNYNITTNALVLHSIQDPGNLGTLIRTAAAMNITNIFIIDSVDPYSPKVIQSTVGTIAYLNIIITSWEEFLDNHKHLATCSLVVNDGQEPSQLNISNSILIVGNEGNGLPKNVINNSTHKMTIPMPGKTESLNAAIAGSIALYIKSNNY